MNKLYFLLFVAVTMISTSCNEEDDMPDSINPENCSVSLIKDESGNAQRIYTYDDQSRLQKVVFAGVYGQERTYEYQGTTVVSSYFYNNNPNIVIVDTIYLNSNDLPSRMVKGEGYVIEITYNGNSEITSYKEVSSYDSLIVVVTYSNGNITQMHVKEYYYGTLTDDYNQYFSYYTDKTNYRSRYDILNIWLTNQVPQFFSKNLIQTGQDWDNNSFSYTYEFNEAGLVSKETYSHPNLGGVSLYEYDCE